MFQVGGSEIRLATSVLFPFGSPDTFGVGAPCFTSLGVLAPKTTFGCLSRILDMPMGKHLVRVQKGIPGSAGSLWPVKQVWCFVLSWSKIRSKFESVFGSVKELTMSRIRISEDILPLGEFKVRASAVLRKLRENGRPFVITQNGRPAAVLLAPEDFDRLTEMDRFVRSVEAGLADAEAGRVLSDDELTRNLDEEMDTADA